MCATDGRSRTILRAAWMVPAAIVRTRVAVGAVAVGDDDVEVGERGRVLLEDVLDAADAAAGVGAGAHDEDGRARLGGGVPGREGLGRRTGADRPAQGRFGRMSDGSWGRQSLDVRHRRVSSTTVE